MPKRIYSKDFKTILSLYSSILSVRFCNRIYRNVLDPGSIRTAFIDSLGIRDLGDVTSGQVGQTHLWYLWGLLIAVLVMYFLFKKDLRVNQILLVSILLHIVTSILRLNSCVEYFIVGGGPFKALAFISMGYYLGKNEVNYNKSLLKSILFMLLYAVIFQFTYFIPMTDLLIVIST